MKHTPMQRIQNMLPYNLWTASDGMIEGAIMYATTERNVRLQDCRDAGVMAGLRDVGYMLQQHAIPANYKHAIYAVAERNDYGNRGLHT